MTQDKLLWFTLHNYSYGERWYSLFTHSQRMNHFISFAICKYIKIMEGVTNNQAKWFRQQKSAEWKLTQSKWWIVDGEWWLMVLLWNYLKGSISIHPLFNWIRHDWICFYVISVLPFSINWTNFITCRRCSQYHPTNNNTFTRMVNLINLYHLTINIR